MSQTENVRNESNLSKQNYNTEKLALWDITTKKDIFENETAGEFTAKLGTVVARNSSGNLVPINVAAADGTQIPFGVVMADYVYDASASGPITVIVGGRITESMVIVPGGDLDTIVDNRTVRDLLASETLGIQTINSVDNSDYDNQ